MSPVGVTLKISHLQQCEWFFCVLFRAVFTVNSGVCLNQCLNRNRPETHSSVATGRPFPGTTKLTGTGTITQITTNKILNPADQLLDKNFVFGNFAVTIRQQHPKGQDVFCIFRRMCYFCSNILNTRKV